MADLDSLALFKGLREEEQREALRFARRQQIGAGVFLYHQGDEAEVLYVLAQGQVKLSQVTPEGQQVILRIASSGDTFGMIAAISGSTYPTSAETVEDSEILVWDQDSIRRLMLAYPQIALNALGILTDRIQEFQDKMRELATERVERRIARSLLRLAKQTGQKTPEGVRIGLPITREELAQMTGTTLYTVSRTLSKWEEMGLISSGRQEITIRFPHGLVAIAEDLPELEQ